MLNGATDWVIYWTLGNFFKPLATINMPKSPTFLGNFCKGVKIYPFPIEIIFGQLLLTFGDFFLVTLCAFHPAAQVLNTNLIVTVSTICQ